MGAATLVDMNRTSPPTTALASGSDTELDRKQLLLIRKRFLAEIFYLTLQNSHQAGIDGFKRI